MRRTIPVDTHIFDVLMYELVGGHQNPAAFLVYLHLFREAERSGGRPVEASLRRIARATGLSKSAVQTALAKLRKHKLVSSQAAHVTACRRHRVLRRW